MHTDNRFNIDAGRVDKLKLPKFHRMYASLRHDAEMVFRVPQTSNTLIVRFDAV